MKMFRSSDTNWLCSVASGLLVLLMFSSTALASDVHYLWQSRDQFVALEPQDPPAAGNVILNDHPVDINPVRLRAMLASIEIRSEDNNKPEQLITNESLEVLVPQLVQGFQQAAPGEDVTFAIIGLYKAMFGFAKTAKVTTGRAFYKAGHFNIIFGLVRKDFNERDDRRLSPFTPGSRLTISKGDWTLLPQPGQNGYNQIRNDWVTFSDAWQMPVAVQNMPVGQHPSAPAPYVRSTDTRSPAERLATLNELKSKGLISEDEYRSKRMEILNGL
ncbi:MAG: SHOCT domain-containing protein [Geobacteraceae bacterium]|nr:SHOCT domain-containing protein [Geobacteraceae bacterium]